MGLDDVVVVIPTKNEEKTIGQILKSVKRISRHILVVDAHSDDRTADIVKQNEVSLISDNGKGKGAALRLAAQHAKKPIIVFIDADGSHDPRDIPKLVKPIQEGKADMVIASRTLGGSAELSGSFGKSLRRFLSWCIDIIINLRFGSHITDAQNGFRAIRSDTFKDLSLTEDVFSIEQEMVMKCLKKGYRIMEVPSFEHARRFGDSNISLVRHGPKYFWCVLKNL